MEIKWNTVKSDLYEDPPESRWCLCPVSPPIREAARCECRCSKYRSRVESNHLWNDRVFKSELIKGVNDSSNNDRNYMCMNIMLLHIYVCRVHAAICNMMMLCSHAWKLAPTEWRAESGCISVCVCVLVCVCVELYHVSVHVKILIIA